MLYNVTLYAKSAGPGKFARLAVVDVFPSRVMMVLRGLYDCITKRVIPDPDTKTMNRGSSRRGRILTREWYLEIARVGLRTEVFCFGSGETWHVRGRIHISRLTVLIERERDEVSTCLSVSH